MDSLLEWSVDHAQGERPVWQAETPFSVYEVCLLPTNSIAYLNGFHTRQIVVSRPCDEAKAACEADFARRLMEVPAVRELVEAGRAGRAILKDWEPTDDKRATARLDKALGVFGGGDE